MHLCGKQCIALRGHRDYKTSDCSSQGNFMAIVNYSIQCGNTKLQYPMWQYYTTASNVVIVNYSIQRGNSKLQYPMW